MKIQLKLFPWRKNIFFALFFILTSFFCFVHGVQADGLPSDPSLLGDPGAWFENKMKQMASGLIDFEALLASAAATIFVWILDPNSFALIMNNGVFYEIWKIVRDTMNMLFILVLLFSAFATIYQIDKYKYNKILWTVIIMALLVNFSWPISRVIIDFFNSMMYFFVQSIFQTNGKEAVSGMLIGANLSSFFLGSNGVTAMTTWPQIFLAMITMFIFAFTVLILSLMMLIRLIALPMLMMVSPIGFAGMVAPLTQTFAKKWWDKLFQYASYGPIAVFMVLASVKILENTQQLRISLGITASGLSAKTGDLQADILAASVFFAIPIILFWIAITSSEKMSGALGHTTFKFASDSVRWARRQPWRGTKGFFRWTGATGGVQQAWQNRRGFFGSDSRRGREEREARLAGRLLGGSVGAQNALDEAFAKRVAAEQEALKKFGNVTQAQTMLRDKNASAEKRKAAALYLAEKEAITGAGDFQLALQSVGKDLTAARGIISKAPKAALTNAAELNSALKILRTNGHQRLLGDMVNKTEKKALGNTGDEYDSVLEQLATRDMKGNVMRDASGEFVIDENLRKDYDKRLVEQGQAHIRVESAINKLKNTTSGPLSPAQTQKAYADVFNKISANDTVKQNEDMLVSADFIEYMRSKTVQSQKEVFAAMSRENKEAVVSAWAGKVQSKT